MQKTEESFEKVRAVIQSCILPTQCKTADRMIDQYQKMYGYHDADGSIKILRALLYRKEVAIETQMLILNN